MKYKQDRNASGEILRLLIQKMSEHPAAFTPLSFAVWYEHVTGMNPPLSEEIEKILQKKSKLDDVTVERLHMNYISAFDEEVESALRNHVFLLLGKIAEFTAETDTQAVQFSNSLQTYSETLKQNLDHTKLVSLIGKMVGDADQMLGFMKNVHSELAVCRLKGEELHQELQAARGEAMTDPLTGILNRRGFENKASQTMLEHKETSENLSLLIIDIDLFKKINDTYGHLFGDKVIRAIADVLKSKVRGQDSVARMGGEEFVVLLADTDSKGAFFVAEQIRKTIEGCKIYPHGAQEAIGGVTVSIGVSLLGKAESLIDLLDHADKALFLSKNSGRNKTTVFAVK
jgi:diguanylate cyclase